MYVGFFPYKRSSSPPRRHRGRYLGNVRKTSPNGRDGTINNRTVTSSKSRVRDERLEKKFESLLFRTRGLVSRGPLVTETV